MNHTSIEPVLVHVPPISAEDAATVAANPAPLDLLWYPSFYDYICSLCTLIHFCGDQAVALLGRNYQFWVTLVGLFVGVTSAHTGAAEAEG